MRTTSTAHEARSVEHETATTRMTRMHDDHGHGHHGPIEPHESPWVVTVPLILLAIPSVVIGFLTIGPMLFGRLASARAADLRRRDRRAATTTWSAARRRNSMAPVDVRAAWLHGAGVLAGVRRLRAGDLPVPGQARTCAARRAASCSRWPVRILENKYGFDDLWIKGFAGGGVGLGKLSCDVRRRRPDRRRGRSTARAGVIDRIRRLVRCAVPVRLPLPLRLRDDPRPDRAAGGADQVLALTRSTRNALTCCSTGPC